MPVPLTYMPTANALVLAMLVIVAAPLVVFPVRPSGATGVVILPTVPVPLRLPPLSVTSPMLFLLVTVMVPLANVPMSGTRLMPYILLTKKTVKTVPLTAVTVTGPPRADPASAIFRAS